MRRISALITLACASSLLATGVPDHNAVSKLLARVPLSFERNAGQADRSVAWVGRGQGYGVAVDATGATIVPTAPGRSDAVRMTFLNARPQAGSTPLEPLPGKTNYLIGAEPTRWLRNLPTFGRIEYRDVYDGIDVAWYGDQGQIEYDVTIRPGADASRIRMSVEGARKLALDADGGVDIETAAGAMKLRLPQIYQAIAGVRQAVQGSFVLDAGNVIGFKLAGYDKTRPLVIDPTLEYGSFIGAGSFSIFAIATDPAGNVYLAGEATAGMATVNALQPGNNSLDGDCFAMKLNPAGTAVLYSTYIGGSTGSAQIIESIAVDSSGELAGTGYTEAKDFPLVNPAWSKFDAVNNMSAIVLKLSGDGSALVYSTYLSGVLGSGVALDGSGNAYVVGDAESTVVATSGAYQTVYGGGENDAFVAKLGKAGALTYLTLLGGSGYDQGTAIAADSAGNAYVAGYTNSTSFPGNPPGARTTNAGGYDAFVAKVSPDGSQVPWLTFFGGTGNETLPVLVRDSSSGMIYIAGNTTSTDLPTTAGVIQPASHGPGQGFIASVNPDGMSFGFATYLGGRKYDTINSITLTPTGQLAVAGSSSSYDFATVNAIEPAFLGNGVSSFSSVNSGGSWTADDVGLPASILAMTSDPSSPNTVLALSATPPAVFRTTNGGAAWAAEPLPTTFWWVGGSPEFARSPANPAVVYAYLPFTNGPPPYEFVFRSIDDGVTWTGLPNPPASATDWLEGIALSGTNAETLVEVFESGDVYRSTDSGATFAALAPLPGWPCGAAWPSALTGSPDGSMYLGSWGGICKSTDNGSTWSQLAATGNWGNPAAIAVSPSNPLAVYTIGGSTVYASPDAGKTWNSGTSPGGSVNTLAVAASNPQVVYAAGGGGVFVSKDGAKTWTPAASLPFSPNAIAVSATNPAAIYTGGNSAGEGFVAKLNTTGTSLLWSTFYSGSNGANPTAIASVASGDVWIAGWTSSPDLPLTANAYSTVTGQHGNAAFLARISDSTAPCSYWLNPSSAISYGAQSLTFSVTAPSGCAWTATPSDSTWITVNPPSGTGSGVVAVTLAANNTGTGTGSVNVNGQSFAITQASGCEYTVSAVNNSATNVPSSGGIIEIAVTEPFTLNCPGTNGPWNVIPEGPGVSVVSGGTGTGNGTVTLSIAPNAGVEPLVTAVQVDGQTVIITEEDDCSYSLSPLTIGPAAQTGSMSVTASPAGCTWNAQSDASWLSINGKSTTGSGTFSFTATVNTTGAPRTAHITLDSRQFTVTQGITTSPGTSALLVGSAGGTASVALTSSFAWTATANSSFLHIASGSAIGTGNALVEFTYDPFTGTGTRTGTLTIAGMTVTVAQAGMNYIGPFGPGPAIALASTGLNQPWSAAVDGAGNVYIADTGNNAVKEWNAATQQVTAIESSGLLSPEGVAVDGAGDVYIADTGHNAIKEWSAATKQVSTLTSVGQVSSPSALAVDGFGNVYIGEFGNPAIEEWSVSTGQVKGLVSPAGINYGLALDGAGNLYFGLVNTIEKLSGGSERQFSMLLPSGLSEPNGVAVDGSGNVTIADTGNNAIKQWNAVTQQVTTLASTGLKAPNDVAVDGSGNVYIADTGNSAIKEIPYAFVGPAGLAEPATAGTDSLLPVLPSTASLTGVYAPTSDQSWLTIGAIANGVVSFSFTANTSATRVAHIMILGEQITVTQNGAQNGSTAQTITFGALANQPLGAAPFAIGATASSGLPVSFASTTPAVCTVSGSEVTLVAAGACTIQAVQAGNAAYAAAAPVDQSFAVTEPAIGGVISAGAFGAFSFAAPGTWVEIYGSNLSSTTRSWTGADFNGNSAPTALSEVQVTIGGQAAFVDYISPGQVNAQLPSNIGTGWLQLTVTNAGVPSSAANIWVNATEPGLLAPPSFIVGGNQYVVAQLADGTYVLPTGAIPGLNSRPAKPGETIVIYGIGFGPVVPNTPAGQMAPASTQLSATLQFVFGQMLSPQISYFGLTPGLVGLYQFNVVVPPVPDSDLLPLSFNLGNAAGAQTLYTAVHQ